MVQLYLATDAQFLYRLKFCPRVLGSMFCLELPIFSVIFAKCGQHTIATVALRDARCKETRFWDSQDVSPLC